MKEENIYRLFFVVICFVFIAIDVYMYMNADEVKCNWIWCEFTFKNNSVSEYLVTNRECYVNDVQVNCSEYDKIKKEFNIGKAIQ